MVGDLLFCGGFERNWERREETESRGGVIYFSPPWGRCGCVAFLHQTPTKASSVARRSPGFTACDSPPSHVRSQERSAGQTRKATSSKCHNSPLNKQQLSIDSAQLQYLFSFQSRATKHVSIFLSAKTNLCFPLSSGLTPKINK